MQEKNSTSRAVMYYIYIQLMDKHLAFITFITQFFPFSLLYEGSLVHATNKSTKILVESLENYLKERKLPILIQSGNLRLTLPTLNAVPIGRYKTSKAQYFVKLQEELQKKYPDIFIHENKTGFMIFVPNETIEKITSKQ